MDLRSFCTAAAVVAFFSALAGAALANGAADDDMARAYHAGGAAAYNRAAYARATSEAALRMDGVGAVLEYSPPVGPALHSEVSPCRLPTWMPATVTRWRSPICAAALEHGVAPELVAIVVLVESGGDPRARSGAGARGLMQVMPGTAADIARWRGLPAGADLYDPATSLDYGAYYLARQLRAFGHADDPDWRTSVDRAAAAYNGGPGSVSGWLRGVPLPAEAERYRRYVGGMWAERDAASSPAFERWLMAGGQRLVDAAAVAL